MTVQYFLQGCHMAASSGWTIKLEDYNRFQETDMRYLDQCLTTKILIKLEKKEMRNEIAMCLARYLDHVKIKYLDGMEHNRILKSIT